MSIAEKLIKIAENEPKVYEAGKISQIQGVEPAEVDASLFGGKLKTIAENTIRVFEKGRNDANLQKATASGEVVRVDDVSPIEHKLKVNLTSDALTNFSGLSVTRYGKNLWLYGDVSFTGNYRLITFNEPLKAGVTYTLSAAEVLTTNTDYPRCLIYGRNVGFFGYLNNGSNQSCSFTPSADCTLLEIYSSDSFQHSAGHTAQITNIQLEYGTTATDYEPYKEPQTAFALADGTVNGLTSLSPTMTLIPDTSGVNINLEYYKDK